jgi:hypothetical protein
VEFRAVGGGDGGGAGGDGVAKGEPVVIDPDGDVQAGLAGALEFENGLVVAVGDLGAFPQRGFQIESVLVDLWRRSFQPGPGRVASASVSDRGGGGEDERFAEGLECIAERARFIECRLGHGVPGLDCGSRSFAR